MNLRLYLQKMMLRLLLMQFIIFFVTMLCLHYQSDGVHALQTIVGQHHILELEKRSWALQWLICFIFMGSVALQLRIWKSSLHSYILPMEEIENVIEEYRSGNKLRRYNIHRKNSGFITIGRMLNRILDDRN